jgi:nitrogen fixation/metabolism regulation signal transduction histidine kinase/CheY-like chemotaxis protein
VGLAGATVSVADNERELARRLEESEAALRSVTEAYAELDLQHRTFFDRAPDGLLAIDDTGRVERANGTARVLLEGEPVGRSLWEFLREPHATAARRLFGAPLLETVDREYVLRTGKTVSVRAAPGPAGTVVVLRDISERLAMRAEVESARRLAAVARIAGGIAHEINNPLTVLQLRADLLLEEHHLPESLQQQVLVVRDSTSRIARTVRTLQRMGRAFVGTPEWTSLRDLVTAALEGAEPPSPVHVALDEATAALGVRGDSAALILALEQLVTFAAEAGEVHLTARQDGARVHVELLSSRATWLDAVVHDPSTTPEAIDSVRLDGRFPGIGLTVAAVIARDHGGEIRTFRMERGGRVLLDLPLAQPGERRATAGRCWVLVVDDEPLVTAMFADWSQRTGHHVDVVGDAETARERIAQDARLEILLVDEQLPAVRGRDLLAWASEHHPRLAARSALLYSPSAREAPAWSRLLAKPFSRRQLAELMDGLLVAGA